MEIIDASKPDEFYDGGDLSWIDFQGAWGNIQTIVSLFGLFKNLSKLKQCLNINFKNNVNIYKYFLL